MFRATYAFARLFGRPDRPSGSSRIHLGEDESELDDRSGDFLSSSSLSLFAIEPSLMISEYSVASSYSGWIETSVC